jgi:predicted Zn-dependent protease with MMP-like domain
MTANGRARPTRDRHGRGLRGPLGPSSVPIVRSRSTQFDELVLDAVDRLQPRWTTELAEVEFGVEDVPPADTDRLVALGAAVPAHDDHPARVVVYRRPIESRAPNRTLLRLIVNDVVVEQVAQLLGRAPVDIDPDYLGDDL